jgi:aminopeptidase N
VGHIQNNAQAHRAVVYDKGALVLDMVRRLIGEEAFKRSLRRLQKEHRFAKVDSETVRKAFESEASIDLDGLWEIFVRNTTIPSMHIETTAAGQEVVVDGYTGPLPVEVKVGEKRLSLIVNGRLLIPGAGSSARVVLDPDGISMVNVSG